MSFKFGGVSHTFKGIRQDSGVEALTNKELSCLQGTGRLFQMLRCVSNSQPSSYPPKLVYIFNQIPVKENQEKDKIGSKPDKNGKRVLSQNNKPVAYFSEALKGSASQLSTYEKEMLAMVKAIQKWRLYLLVKKFLQQCDVCQRFKVDYMKPAGLLQPLSIPAKMWSDVSMDFIEGLPLSSEYSVIMVVVDRLTKYAHFVALKHPFTAMVVAKSFIANVVRLYGIPTSIMSDHDKVFISSFWQALFKLQGIKLCMSSNYHPQIDGQIVVVNLTLEQYLRPYKVLEKVSPVAYKLALSNGSQIHDVFHVSLLRKHIGSLVNPISVTLPHVTNGDVILPQPEVVIYRQVIHKGKYRPNSEVLIKWKGARVEDATWENEWRFCK
nr:transposon Ty3-G Gag-Pol polyprotein [Tanacetum cinerariifolium]